jgi:hypothetical protein
MAASMIALHAGPSAAFQPPDQWTIEVIEVGDNEWQYNIDPAGVTAFRGRIEFDTNRLGDDPQFQFNGSFVSADFDNLGGGFVEVFASVEEVFDPELAVSGDIFSVSFNALDDDAAAPFVRWFGEGDLLHFTWAFDEDLQPLVFDDWNVSVPEPGSMTTLAIGLVSLVVSRGRRRSRLGRVQ